MKILFDNGTPKPIARRLIGHEVAFARRIGWHELENGELIEKAEEAGYEVLLRTDKNIRYQQNLSGRKIALVVPGNSQWPLVRLYLDKIASAVEAATPGSYAEVELPSSSRPCSWACKASPKHFGFFSGNTGGHPVAAAWASNATKKYR